MSEKVNEESGKTAGETMRKYMYLIVDSPKEDHIGKAEISERDSPGVTKNEKTKIDKRNTETGDSYTETVVGMGYADFDSEQDYHERIPDVMKQKLAEIDQDYIVEAGLDPVEVLGHAG